ncbi:uncharacterized protein AMSG_05219 [Thecamonas trahens ATCC 50062]|uniref:Uncharacterized protein n=1 Tax=Thecamonas trahens ATCC 50062 TaxID=461836 RepID=A0A0L0DAG7_THETB|nr:hypothetical protein AMSG_05219 [Thecamonas trahens ATCC 50062]KNC49230.1 hypothetical protein AMSG_05219 [Thecamonas trahens ATCC 50062]|eukprot:XP_013757948.1 hypothetical protein AMSG_05219 [Thecamonas trahens ATCC 50062]
MAGVANGESEVLAAAVEALTNDGPLQATPVRLTRQARTASEAVVDSARGAAVATSTATQRSDLSKKGTGLALLNKYIVNALKAVTAGQSSSKHYHYVLAQVSSSNARTRIKFINALSTCVSSFGEEHLDLVRTVCALPMSGDADMFRSYANFLINLVSANTRFLPPILAALIRNLKPSDELSANELKLIRARVHEVLQAVLALVPTAPTVLQGVLMRAFPHPMASLLKQTVYVQNLLDIARYSPMCRNGIVASIVDHVIKLDAMTAIARPILLDRMEDGEYDSGDDESGDDESGDDEHDEQDEHGGAALPGTAPAAPADDDGEHGRAITTTSMLTTMITTTTTTTTTLILR